MNTKRLLMFLIVLAATAALLILFLFPWWLTLTLIAIALLFLPGPFLRLINASLAEIELAHAAVVTRGGREIGPKEETFPSAIQRALGFTKWFGKREGGLLFGGRHLKWFFEEANTLPLKNDSTGKIEVRFNTKDKPKLICTFPIHFRPDPRLYEKGSYLYFYVEPEKRNQIISESLESKIGGIGSRYDSLEFIENRQAITDIINCALRLSKLPHLLHVHEDKDHTPNKRLSKKYCGLGADCPFKELEHSCVFVPKQTERGVEYVPEKYAFIQTPDLLRYYNVHQPAVREILQNESGDAGDHSRAELNTGTDIFEVPVTAIDFPPEVEKAFAQQRQLEQNRESFNEILKMDGELEQRGYPPQLRANLIQTHTGQAQPRQVVSVEGGGQAVVVTGGLSNLFGGHKEKRDPDKKDKKGGS